jgi:hypothetical protein
MNTIFRLGRVGVVTLLLGAAAAMPALAHHSFAIFNMEQTRVFTGVVTRINPDANHLQIFFVPMNDERKGVLRSEDGKPMVWAVEMAGSAQAATQGISVNSLPPGTYISVALHPLRSGEAAGSRAETGAIYRCPDKKAPEAGKHCDTVEGRLAFGEGPLAAAKD